MTPPSVALAESIATVDTTPIEPPDTQTAQVPPPPPADPPPTQRRAVPSQSSNATLTFVDLPPNAIITVNDSVVQADSVNLPPGTYNVVIQAQGYEPYAQEITLDGGDRRRFIASDLAPVVVVSRRMGGLSVGSLPPGVLFINNVRIDEELPIRDYQLQEGEYRIRIEAPDYEPHDTTITIVGDSTVNLRLIRLRRRGAR